MEEIEEGLKDSICKDCKNWIFNDWYMCIKFLNCDKEGFIMLPVIECKGFAVKSIL